MKRLTLAILIICINIQSCKNLLNTNRLIIKSVQHSGLPNNISSFKLFAGYNGSILLCNYYKNFTEIFESNNSGMTWNAKVSIKGDVTTISNYRKGEYVLGCTDFENKDEFLLLKMSGNKISDTVYSSIGNASFVGQFDNCIFLIGYFEGKQKSLVYSENNWNEVKKLEKKPIYPKNIYSHEECIYGYLHQDYTRKELFKFTYNPKIDELILEKIGDGFTLSASSNCNGNNYAYLKTKSGQIYTYKNSTEKMQKVDEKFNEYLIDSYFNIDNTDIFIFGYINSPHFLGHVIYYGNSNNYQEFDMKDEKTLQAIFVKNKVVIITSKKVISIISSSQ